MKMTWTVFFILVGVAVHSVNDLTGLAPATWKPWLDHASEILTAIFGWRALFINPNGTPAELPWTPKQ